MTESQVRRLGDEDELVALLGVDLAKEQLAAVTAPLMPGAVIAGAGSGKTTVMAARVVWLVGHERIRPDQVLGLTFTTKAAAQLSARIRSALSRLDTAWGSGSGEEGPEPTVFTYHAYAGALVGEHGLRLGFEPDLRLVSDASCFQRAARVVERYAPTSSTLAGDLAAVVRDVVRLDAQLADHLVELDELRDFDLRVGEQLSQAAPVRLVRDAATTALRRAELVELVARYRAAKTADGVTDFSEQMARGARLAVGCEQVSRGERDRYRVVLLDEYQDTSVSQRRMLQGLFSGATPAAGRGHPVTAVGDPCQAIYGWRGATADNLDSFPEHFPRPDGRPAPSYELMVNRRCDSRILDAANLLAAPLHEVHRGVQPLQPRTSVGPGVVRTACLSTVTEEVDWLAGEVLAAHTTRRYGVQTWSDIAVLVRDGAEIGVLAAALRDRHVPVEVVGLCGLLRQPEVAEVVATLQVIGSATANPALVRLLTGPRWRIGARDLALLGQRAAQLAGEAAPVAHETGLEQRLAVAIAGTDVTEMPSLSDALEEPGRLEYSTEARQRFGCLAAELRALRRHLAAPLAELVLRVIETIGLDLELGADPSPQAAQARDNLAALCAAVGDFAAAEPATSLAGLLAYLRAEEDYATGMSMPTASGRDSVTVMTVHKAKGLEWSLVFLPFMAASVFPNERPRPRWTSTAAELPFPLRGDAASLPQLTGWTASELTAFTTGVKDDAALEERRLGYVALTRAKHGLVASAHWWGRRQVRPRGPAAYLRQLRSVTDDQLDPWAGPPADSAANPLLRAGATVAWPAPLDPARIDRRRTAAEAVRDALADSGQRPLRQPPAVASPAHDRLAELDAEIDALVAERASGPPADVEVTLPSLVSTTDLVRLRADPARFAAELVRPMPRAVSRSARLGTRFHAWVASSAGQQALLRADELLGAADDGEDGEDDLASLAAAFAAGPFAERPARAVEVPFSLPVGEHSVAGRIDAVFAEPDGDLVVDWKTHRTEAADPLQLAIYRLAWAELAGLRLEHVGAAFYYVRTGELVRCSGLPDRPGIERLLGRLR